MTTKAISTTSEETINKVPTSQTDLVLIILGFFGIVLLLLSVCACSLFYFCFFRRRRLRRRRRRTTIAMIDFSSHQTQDIVGDWVLRSRPGSPAENRRQTTTECVPLSRPQFGYDVSLISPYFGYNHAQSNNNRVEKVASPKRKQKHLIAYEIH